MENSSATTVTTGTYANWITGATSVAYYYWNYGSTAGWYTINLTTPFTYTGGSLQMGVRWHLTGSSSGSIKHYSSFQPQKAEGDAMSNLNSSDDLGNTSHDDYRPNIKITYTGGCEGPSSLTVTPTSTTTASASWTAASSAPSNDYDFYFSTSSATPTSSTSPNLVGVSGTSTGISGLTANTTWYVWMRSNCGSSNGSWVSGGSFYTGYCVPAPSSVDGSGITNVSAGTINNTTTTESNNYGDFTAQSTDVVQGANLAVDITYTTGYTYVTKIWVDWNNDLDFDDSGEEVYSGTSNSTSPTTLAASFTVPSDASVGSHRMRIGGTDTGPPTPCYTGTWGSYEDYSINVTASAPPTISSLDLSTICEGGTLTITGTNLSGATAVSVGGTAVSSITSSNATTVVVVVGAGTTGTVSVTTSTGTAVSASTVTVNASPAAVTVAGAGTYCDNTTLTASNGSDGTIYWQGTSSGGTSTANSGPTSPTYSSTGTYYARARSSAGCWGTEDSDAITINATPNSVTVTGGGAICENATLSASGGSGGTIYWQGTNSGGTSTAGTSGGTSPAITTTGTYYARAENGGCWGTEGSAAVTVTALPSAVTVTGGGTICENATLSASGGSGGTIYWQGTNSGGTSTGSGSGATSPAITATGTYYARALNGSCWGQISSGEVVSTLTPAPSSLTATADGASSADICSGGTVALAGSATLSERTLLSENFDGGVPPSGWSTSVTNSSYTWTSLTGGFNMTGNHAAVAWDYSQNEKLITPTVNLNNLNDASLTFDLGIQYYWAIDQDNYDFFVKVSTNGGSTWQTIYSDDSDITGSGGYIAVSPVIDISSFIGNNVIFSFEYVGNDGSDLYMDEISITGNASITYDWSEDGGVSTFATGSSTTSNTLSSNTTITMSATDSYSGCTSTTTTSVTVAAPPSITTATDLTTAANTCGETELTITTDGSGGSGEWTYSGGLVSYNNSNATDATINVTPQPSDVNTPITMTWTVNGGEICDGSTVQKVIQFNQPTAVSNPDNYCYLWGGLTSADNATGSNWYKWDATKSMWARQSAAPSASTDKLHVLTTDNNCIHASNTMTLGTTTLASLNVGSGASMSLGSGTVTLNGDLTNAGTINEGTGTVSLTSAGDQTLSGGGTTNFNNLTLNKTSDNLVLSSPATVKGTLTMNKGNINNGSNILTIGESSASPGAITHNSGSVTGKLRRYFADASSSSKSFPIGNASTTRDVTVSFGSTPGSNQFLTASYNAGYPQLSGADLYAGLPLTTADGQLIQNYDDEGYWEINPGSTATGAADDYSADINSAAYNLTIHMNGLTGANSASMDRNKVRIIKSAGPSHTSWEALTHGSISGSVDSDYTVTASGSGFSFFGAGTDDGNALPVELISFNGVCNEGVVDLVWQTASEQNSEYFEVAYSRDGVDWKTIHTETAAGFSNTLITYDYTHEGAVSGNNYYRLTQNDIDGASVVYDNLILNANCQATSEGYLSVYPNPSSGTFQVIMNNESLKGAANINMVDTKGNIVFTKPIEVNSGINMYVIQELLSPGIYYIHIENGTMRTTVVKHSIR
jgi:hypothetical protein